MDVTSVFSLTCVAGWSREGRAQGGPPFGRNATAAGAGRVALTLTLNQLLNLATLATSSLDSSCAWREHAGSACAVSAGFDERWKHEWLGSPANNPHRDDVADVVRQACGGRARVASGRPESLVVSIHLNR